VSLATEILARWAPNFLSVRLQSSDHGKFEGTLDGDLLFSKATLGRHARRGEVINLFEQSCGRV